MARVRLDNSRLRLDIRREVMVGEHVSLGLQVRLRPRGPGRFFAAGFLAFWLCGWAAGEVVVLTILVRLVISWVTGEPGPMKEQPEATSAVLGVGFILVWLAFWTFGGIMAMRQLLLMVWAEDRIIAAAHGLIIEHRIGPFRSRREIRRDELLRIHVPARAGKLAAETASGSVEISSLGTAEERMQAATILSDHLGLVPEPDADEFPVGLPQGWSEVISPEGDVVLVEDPGQRSRHARIVLGLATAAAVGAMLLMLESLGRPNLLPLSTMACVAALGLAAAANWLYRGRMEWRVGGGNLVLRRRYGRRVRDVFHARALELTVSPDSDNDEWYELAAIAGEYGEPPGAGGSKKTRRRIDREMHDPTSLRRLGRWLAGRTGLPFSDRTTREERAADLARFKEQLSDQGRFGRWIVRLIEQAEKRRQTGKNASEEL